MIQYSLVDRRPEETILDLLHQNNIAVLARGALAQGLLVDKPAKDYLNNSKEEMANACKAIHEVAATQHSAAQTAIQYVLHHPAVSSAVIGIRNMKQLKEATTKSKKLLKKDVEKLQQAVTAKTYEQHR